MVPVNYFPDWLISPPPKLPYLTKKEYVTKNKLADNFLIKYYKAVKNKDLEEYETFKKYVSHDKDIEIKTAQDHVKRIQSKLDENKENNKNKYIDYK